MKRDNLKKILSTHYSKDSVKSLLCGRMKPSYKVMTILNASHGIPFGAWEDIKSYVNRNISDSETLSEIENNNKSIKE